MNESQDPTEPRSPEDTAETRAMPNAAAEETDQQSEKDTRQRATKSEGSKTSELASPDEAIQSGETSSNEKIGEFQILRRLGKGGMGDVYLAKQTSLGRDVALKVMRKDAVNEDRTHLDRFKTEAMAAAHLNHPNIVQVYLIGEEDGNHFIAQEYVKGKNLREFISKKGPPALPTALHIIKQAAMALKKAGDAGIVHRDIKPENIMVTSKGVVKVADFGLARLTLGRENVNLTQVGMTMGTPSYMSPEQVNGTKVDKRSDIYSLGVTCYHLFAGRPPFRGETALAVALKHIKDEPPSLAELRPDLPKSVCDMVHKMMSKKAGSRYQDASEILEDIRKIQVATQKGKDVKIRVDEFVDEAEESTSRKSKNSQKRWLHSPVRFVLACLLLMAMGAGVGWISRTKDLFAEKPAEKTGQFLPNIQEQYDLARNLVNDETAWMDVIRHPDNSRVEKDRAKEQLAIMYLQQKRFNEATKFFREFKSHGSAHEDLHAKGIAGLAIVASLQGNLKESNNLINLQLKKLADKLNGKLRELVVDTIKRNRETLGKEVPGNLEEYFIGAPVEGDDDSSNVQDS